MNPFRPRLPLARVAVALLLVASAGCLGNDFREAQLGIEKWDHGWLVAIEPEEEFSVDLLGSSAYPGYQWEVAEYDSTVLELVGEEYEEPRPPAGDPNATEAGDYDPGSLVTRSAFRFAGIDLGQTPLRFELLADGELIDIAEYSVAVVDDACEAETAAVANRCGGPGFAYHPQVLFEYNFGEETAIEVGATVELVLTANALHQDLPWTVVDYDESVIGVEGPSELSPARSAGDFGEVDEESSHSFLPTWQYTITGVAPGRSALTLEIAVNGEPVDVFEMDVVVVGE